MIKQLFTDMDGTLLNPQGELSPATIQAVKQADLPLTLVSARAAADMLRFVEALGLTGPQIGFNGALIYQVNHHQIESRSEIPLSKTSGLKIIQAVQKHFPEVLTFTMLPIGLPPNMTTGLIYKRNDPTLPLSLVIRQIFWPIILSNCSRLPSW